MPTFEAIRRLVEIGLSAEEADALGLKKQISGVNSQEATFDPLL
jgi:hypothetical protein